MVAGLQDGAVLMDAGRKLGPCRGEQGPQKHYIPYKHILVIGTLQHYLWFQ